MKTLTNAIIQCKRKQYLHFSKWIFFFFLFSTNLSNAQRAYYPFNGNSLDASGNGNNSSFNNATLTTDRFGTANSAYHFNGLNQFIQIPNSATLNMANKISLCAWVRPTGFYTGLCYNNAIIMKQNTDYQPGNYSLRFSDIATGCSGAPTTAAEQFYGNVGNGAATGGVVAPAPTITLNQWYSVVYTNDGTIGKIYVNCILRDSAVVGNTFNLNNGLDVFLGRMNSAAYPYWFNGDMDEVTIYDRALSQAEVNTYGGCSTCPNDTTVVKNKCINQNITLTARAGTTYSWSPSTGLSATNIQNPVCSATTNTNYVCSITNSVTGCTYKDNVSVIVNAAPTSFRKDTSMCAGDTLQLLATGGTSYSWTPATNISNTTIANPLVWPSSSTTYIVTITNANGCSASDTINITVSNCHCEDSCNWSLTGNTNVKSRNFIGSLNFADFRIRTNNIQRAVVTASGNVGIGTNSPAKLLDVNGEAGIRSLPAAAVNNSIVMANTAGDLKSLTASGNTSQYLSGDGTWQNLPGGGGTVSADQGCTVSNNTVLLGDQCSAGGGQFAESREVNMNDQNLYFNSLKNGKLFMGNTTDNEKGCRELYTRLEISSVGLRAGNNYLSPLPSTSGLRFSDLNAKEKPIRNASSGVLSLDDDGDVIWVQACCDKGLEEQQLSDILSRLDKLEKDLAASKEQNVALAQQLTQMNVVLDKTNTIILNQNVPNPFAESTVITYNIPNAFKSAMIVFTGTNGEVVKTAEIKTVGKGMVNVFAKGISSGLYTYTLVVDGKSVESKKMIKL